MACTLSPDPLDACGCRENKEANEKNCLQWIKFDLIVPFQVKSIVKNYSRFLIGVPTLTLKTSKRGLMVKTCGLHLLCGSLTKKSKN